MAEPTTSSGPGRLQQRWVMVAVVLAAAMIRIALLPTEGFVGDIDQFVEWVGHIGNAGLAHAYDTPISFGPVMVFVWWLLGLFDPALVAAAGTSADPAVRVAMKLPAIVADFALAGIAWSALRARPGWAAAAATLLLLHPAIWFVSAWWGTYDSVYAAFAVAAFALTVRHRHAWAVVALVLAAMAKPQAAPLAVPFAGWFLAVAGWRAADGRRTIGRAIGRLTSWGAVGIGTLVVLWLPFLAANGPRNYIAALAQYQVENYAILSISAWNPWWIFQEVVAGGAYVIDSSPFVGNVSFRAVGYVLTSAALFAVALAVARRPTPRQLAFGLAAAAVIAFELLTTMHERYAFAVLPMAAFVIDDRRIRWFIALFGTAIALNLVSVPHQYITTGIPFHGPATIVGSALCFVSGLFLFAEVLRGLRQPEPPSAINDSALAAGGAARPSTSAGSAAATSGA